MTIEKHIEHLMRYVEEVEVEEGVDYLTHLTETDGEVFVMNEVIQLFLHVAGERWHNNQGISLADTYICAKIVKEYLEKYDYHKVNLQQDRIAVFGNIINDYQSSGRKLVVRYLEMAGWTVYDLGNNVSPRQFVEEAERRQAEFIGVSAMLYENALHIKALVDLLEETYDEANRPKLIAGGAVFNVVPTLVESIGVRYTAMNAYDALKLFNRLYEEGQV